MPTKDQVTDALRAVIDPELRRSIVDLGMVRSIEIFETGKVEVVVSLTTAGCPIRNHFQQAVASNVAALDGVTEVGVGFDVLSDEEKGRLQQALGRPGGLPEGALAAVKNVICIASGKGGVGKSTMTANLAAALQAEGHSAGALDADVYGYSIPRMLGVDGKPDVNAERKILPMLNPAGIKVMSIGFFLESNAAVVWRGPMLHKAIQQFLEDVAWDELDYLLLDLPPGTGDVSMTLAQLLPQARVIIVTTPQPAAQSVARRAADMAGKVDLEVLGVIENMSGFTTPDGQRFTIFGEGGGQLLADDLDVPLLGKVPLSEDLRVHADTGEPLVLERSGRTRLGGDPPGRPRDHRRDSAGAAGDAGRDADRAGAAADRRHRAAGRPGPGLSALDEHRELNRAWWDERVPIHVASDFYDVEGFRAGAGSLRPFELEEVGDVAGKRLAAPAVPLRPRLALLGAARGVGRRARLLRARGCSRQRARGRDRARRQLRRRRRLRRSRGARWRALRRRLHRARGAQLAPRPAAGGRTSSPPCSRPAGFCTWPSSTPSPDVFADEDLSVAYDYFHDPAGIRLEDDGGTYADLEAQTASNATHEWAHPISEVLAVGAWRRPATGALQRARLHALSPLAVPAARG